ncbi:MAG: ATP synthase gamma chain [candidate division TM6 bacterium GW2011_GWF2_32_72]|nr:MAG: ATP synthase gamma chain [candidate division TM6 bacterium GW2011_GWF2_32_72]
MAQLIQMRQRIKAVQTIKKVTHAMRLISMSSHAKLRNKRTFIEKYKEELTLLLSKIKTETPDWQNKILFPNNATDRNLAIFVGSQKGLCGNFNLSAFAFFAKEIHNNPTKNLEIISIGKNAFNLIQHEHGKLIKSYNQFTANNLENIANEIANLIWNQEISYNSVTVYSNTPITFFAQKPISNKLIPFDSQEWGVEKTQQQEDYIWMETKEDLLNDLGFKCLKINLQLLFFKSLLAEQAARFISMDGATRNANKLLDTMQLQYNKLRQTKITKELAELTGGFIR